MRPPIGRPPIPGMMPMQQPYSPHAAFDQRLMTPMFSSQLTPGDVMALMNRSGNAPGGALPFPYIMELGGSTGVSPSAPVYTPNEAMYGNALATVGNGRPMGQTPNIGTAYREWLANNRQAPQAQRTPPQFPSIGQGQGATRTTFQDRVAQQRAAKALAAQQRIGNTQSSGDGTGMGRVWINGDATGMGDNAAGGRATFQQRVNARRGGY